MRRYLIELAEQTAATYGVAFLGLLLADGVDLADVGVWRAAAVAAVPAGLYVVKGALGRLVGDRESPAWLPGGGGRG